MLEYYKSTHNKGKKEMKKPVLLVHRVIARDLPDLWFRAVNDIFEYGRRFTVDKGSYEGQTRLEYDYFFGQVLDPSYGSGTMEILPQIPNACGIPNPVEFEYVYGGKNYERSYVEYLMTAVKQPNELYTYGERLVSGAVLGDRNKLDWDGMYLGEINQIQHVINTYKEFGHRNNQMVLQIGQPGDLMLNDPPCLRQIDTRVQDGALHFIIYFRSWDLWGGLPANLAGIETLHQYMAGEIGVQQGNFLVESKGLHLYGYAEDLAKIRCMKEITDGTHNT
jgi:thymidylate synthase